MIHRALSRATRPTACHGKSYCLQANVLHLLSPTGFFCGHSSTRSEVEDLESTSLLTHPGNCRRVVSRDELECFGHGRKADTRFRASCESLPFGRDSSSQITSQNENVLRLTLCNTANQQNPAVALVLQNLMSFARRHPSTSALSVSRSITAGTRNPPGRGWF